MTEEEEILMKHWPWIIMCGNNRKLIKKTFVEVMKEWGNQRFKEGHDKTIQSMPSKFDSRIIKKSA